MRMTDTIRVKEESDTMKCSEAEIKDNTALEQFVRSEGQEQIQAEKVERCTDNKNDVQRPAQSFGQTGKRSKVQ